MNNDRRKEIAAIIADVQDLAALLQAASDRVQEVRNGEQDAFDNMPESLQDSERGQRAQGALDELEDALGAFEDFDADSLVLFLEAASE